LDENSKPCVLRFGEPALYRIVVPGQLDERNVRHIGDARVEMRNSQSTTLVVLVMDQAGLSGVLNGLYGLHMPILSIEYVSDKPETGP